MRLFSARWGIAFFAIAAVSIWASVGMAQTLWEKYPENPVLHFGPPGAWDDDSVGAQSVLFDGTEYRMWYRGVNGEWMIGYATSPDGIEWTKHVGNPVLNPGSGGSWDDDRVDGPNVFFDGTEYKMWYDGHDGSHLRIGYATSPNGITWTKHSGNPVLDLGPSGSWDDYRVFHPSVVANGTRYRFWFTGSDGSHERISYAISLPDCTDFDADGSWDEACGGFDCDDSDPDIYMGAIEICDDAIDNDCDGLIDDLDPDCFPEFILDVDASFTGGKLYLDYTLGTERQATWINYAILGYPGPLEFIHLWTIQVPAIVPPAEIPLSFWFPSVGYAGIYSAIYAGGVQEIAVLKWVDTGK